MNQNNKGFKQTYYSIIYLVGDFIFALLYFCIVLVLLTAGFGLTICWIGIPIIIFLYERVKGFTEKERKFTIKHLHISIDKLNFYENYRENMLDKFKKVVKDKKFWNNIKLHMIKLPITMVTFTACVALFLLPLILIVAPVLYSFTTYNIFIYEVTTFFQAIILAIIGLALINVLYNAINGIALRQGLFLKNYLEKTEIT